MVLRNWNYPASRVRAIELQTMRRDRERTAQKQNGMNKELTRLRLSQTNRPCDVILYWHEKGYLRLDPPYQRGDVWGDQRRRNLIRSIVLGVPIPSIIINDRMSARWAKDYTLAVIDGKQRITAVLRFMQDDLDVPGEWFGMQGDVKFSMLSDRSKRGFHNHPMAFTEGQLGTLEEEQQVFDLVNFGGLSQGEQDTPTGEENE